MRFIKGMTSFAIAIVGLGVFFLFVPALHDHRWIMALLAGPPHVVFLVLGLLVASAIFAFVDFATPPTKEFLWLLYGAIGVGTALALAHSMSIHGHASFRDASSWGALAGFTALYAVPMATGARFFQWGFARLLELGGYPAYSG